MAPCAKLVPAAESAAVPWRRSGGVEGDIMADQIPGGSGGKAKLGAGAIASLVGVALLLIFIFQNTEKIRLHFLVWNFVWPLWLFTIVTAVFGALIWFGLGVMRRHRRRKARRAERRDYE
jgi:uncharacterized integral membrane protein